MKVIGRIRSLTTALVSASALLGSGAALAAELTVTMDEGRMLTFRTPVKTVFVGNPLIADVTVVDEKHVFLTGKNFGTTNLVVLNESGAQIANERITVLGRSSNIVTLQRGPSQTTLACAGERCVPAPTQGDNAEAFEAVAGQVQTREAGVRAAAAAQ